MVNISGKTIKKLNMKNTILYTSFSASLLMAGMSHAATLTASGDLLGGTAQTPAGVVQSEATATDVTFTNTQAGGASASTTSGIGDLLDYSFFSGTTVLAGSGSQIGAFTLSNTGPNPGAVASNAIFDFTDAGGTLTTGASATAAVVNGTVDITGLTAGSLFVLYGTFADANEVTLTLSGVGQENIVASGGSLDPIGNTPLNSLTQFNFDNPDLLYDTLTLSYRNGDLDGSRARFSGVVLTGQIPEPSSAMLLGLGMTAFILRRRK